MLLNADLVGQSVLDLSVWERKRISSEEKAEWKSSTHSLSWSCLFLLQLKKPLFREGGLHLRGTEHCLPSHSINQSLRV